MARLLGLFGLIVALSATAVSGCKTTAGSKVLDSGLGGEVTGWTCDELRSQHEVKRRLLATAIDRYLASAERVEKQGSDSGTSPLLPAPVPDEAVLTSGARSLGKVLAERIPTLPPRLAAFEEYKDAETAVQKEVTDCDAAFSEFGNDGSTEILEQCHFAIELWNVLRRIEEEYNYGKNGQCLTNREAFQGNQTSVRFPYCANPCRFGNSLCVKCEFDMEVLGVAKTKAHYICGDELDARTSVQAHCRGNGQDCAPEAIRCKRDNFATNAGDGTTSPKENETTFTARAEIGTNLEFEIEEAVYFKASNETRFSVEMSGAIQFQNEAGEPILSVNGGNFATTYACSVAVTEGHTISIGGEVGAGFDLVVVSGKATVAEGVEFEALTQYKTKSRPVPMAGVSLAAALDNCKRFSKQWAKSDLPALVKGNVVVKAVAARFMGVERDLMVKPLKGVYCQTGSATYRIDTLKLGLARDGIRGSFEYVTRHRPLVGSYKASERTVTPNEVGADYPKLREKIFNGLGDLTPTEIRNLTVILGFDLGLYDCNAKGW